MLSCPNKCDLLKKCIREISIMINNMKRNRNEDKLIKYFEDNFVALIPNHTSKCAKNSINTIIFRYDHDPTMKETIVQKVINNTMFNFATILLEYGADGGWIKNIENSRFHLISRSYFSDDLDSNLIRDFIERGPKTYAEYIFVRNLFQNLTMSDLTKIIWYLTFCVDTNVFKLMIEYGTNLDKCYKDKNSVSLLVGIIGCIAFVDSDIINEMCDILFPNYNFTMEGPGINYIHPKSGEELNVLEYAESKMGDDHGSIFYDKVINYFNHKIRVDAINKFLPMPIAEDIIPHIVVGSTDYL